MALARFFTTALLMASFAVPAASWAQEPSPASPPRSTIPADEPSVSSDEARRIHEAIEDLTELNAAPDNGIPRNLLERAEAIIVIPSLVKGGFIVGGKHGKGVVSIRDRASNSWSAPAFINLIGGSIGWQIGVESVDLVLLVMNKDGVNQLLEDQFTIGGALSVAAGPVGRSAEASANAQMNAGILAYSKSKGLFAGATLEGAKLDDDDSDNAKFYGKPSTIREITSASFASSRLPAAAQAWRVSLARLTGATVK
jgi:lipid-binding SYLF domain-containing protein